jgi:hypothetical protein
MPRDDLHDESAGHLLGRWFARPLDAAAAERLLAHADARAERRRRRGATCHTCRLQRIAALFWLGRTIEDEAELLATQVAGTAHGRVLLHSLLGQLLLARRQPGALPHLERAFDEGRALLAPGDYFRVLGRLELWRRLPPLTQPAPAFGLEQLLATAGVIDRLQRNAAPLRPPFRRDDTVG